MENFRSMSCREGRGKMESFNSNNNGGDGDQQSKAGSGSGYPSNMQDLRSYSTSYAPSSSYYPQNPNSLKENKNQNQTNGDQRSSSKRSSGGWGLGLGDPELQRKKRVASYKVYAVEGKMKGSLRKSFRWIKNTCSQVVHGFR